MKKSLILYMTIAFCGFLPAVITHAQDPGNEITGGTIKYSQVKKFFFNYTPTGDAARDNAIANLPRSQKMAKILYFSNDYSLYTDGLTADNEEIGPRVKAFLDRMAASAPPKPEIKNVYFDHKKGRKTELVELLTRFFLIEGKVQEQSWKPGTGQRTIQGYSCQEATMKTDDGLVTAWFAPEIPVSIGPESYFGLPGLILAIDINTENIILATSVELTPPEADKIIEPKEGKKTSQKEFNEILAQKIAEFESTVTIMGSGGDRRD